MKTDNKLFNVIFSSMGLLLLGIAGWIGTSVAHIPAIEQKLEDFIKVASATLEDHESRLRSQDERIHTLEAHKK